MFSFLNPIFLWGALAAVVPLVLHLMQRRRIIRMPFSTLRFLKLAERRSAQRVRMENLLLWLLRTLIILALVGAFAVPVIKTSGLGALLRRSSRDVAIVLDGSYSMGYAVRQTTAWEQAIDAAVDIVSGLRDGDRVCIVVARDVVDAVLERPTLDRDFAVAQLEALASSPTDSQLAPAIAAAYSALEVESGRREREIHVITDGQALPWRDVAADASDSPDDAAPPAPEAEPSDQAAWPPEDMDDRTTFFVTLTGATTPNNQWLDTVRVQPRLVMSNTPCRVTVDVGSMGTAREPVASLFIDDEHVSERAAAATGGQAVFALPPLPPGIHAGRVEIAPDGLPLDDTFHFLLRVRQHLPVLCVGDDADVFFLSKALSPRSPGSLVSVTVAGDRELMRAELDEYLVAFLCNALPLPGQIMTRLEDYAARGGHLVVFPGDRAQPSDYAAWRSLEPMAPGRVGELMATMQRQTLRWEQPPPALLKPVLPDPGSAPVLPIQRRLEWSERPDNANILLIAGADAPFLLTRTFGKGRVFLCAVPADRSWSGLPLSPFYLPLVHRMVQLGAGSAESAPFAWASRRLPVAEYVAGIATADSLIAPDGAVLDVSGSADGQGALHVADAMTPGLYEHQTAGGADALALAINARRNESDLTPVDVDAIGTWIAADNVTVSRGRQALQRSISDHRQGRTLGEQLLWLALLLSLAEVVYANWKAHRLQGTPGRLHINPAGKIDRRPGRASA